MKSNKISGFRVMYKRNIHKNKFMFCQLSTYSSFHTPAVTAMREPRVQRKCAKWKATNLEKNGRPRISDVDCRE